MKRILSILLALITVSLLGVMVSAADHADYIGAYFFWSFYEDPLPGTPPFNISGFSMHFSKLQTEHVIWDDLSDFVLKKDGEVIDYTKYFHGSSPDIVDSENLYIFFCTPITESGTYTMTFKHKGNDCEVPAFTVVSDSDTNPEPEPWYETLPGFLQWILRNILFGWLLMNW